LGRSEESTRDLSDVAQDQGRIGRLKKLPGQTTQVDVFQELQVTLPCMLSLLICEVSVKTDHEITTAARSKNDSVGTEDKTHILPAPGKERERGTVSGIRNKWGPNSLPLHHPASESTPATQHGHPPQTLVHSLITLPSAAPR
jgi:hypothetical protein